MTIKNTVTSAMREIKRGTNEHRGVGCASIHMSDGRMLYVVHMFETTVAEITDDGKMIVREAEEIEGDVDYVSWTVDELGGIYM